MLHSQSKTKIQWVHGLNEEDKASFLSLLQNSQTVLGKLKDILSKELASIEAQEISKEAFDSPNWPYLQAYRNGQKNIYKKVIDLLALT